MTHSVLSVASRPCPSLPVRMLGVGLDRREGGAIMKAHTHSDWREYRQPGPHPPTHRESVLTLIASMDEETFDAFFAELPPRTQLLLEAGMCDKDQVLVDWYLRLNPAS